MKHIIDIPLPSDVLSEKKLHIKNIYHTQRLLQIIKKGDREFKAGKGQVLNSLRDLR